MNGKNKCKLLKQIRQKIADENDIQYVTTECKFQGQCTGTCPKCEAELRYLEQELDKRKKAGKAIAVAGIAAAMVVTATGCDLFGTSKKGKATIGDVPYEETTEAVEGELTENPKTDVLTAGAIVEPLEGDVPYEEADPTGEADYKQTTEDLILTGDVAWPIP